MRAHTTKSGFTTRTDPYATMGTSVESAPNAEEALVLANLDFEVAKAALYAEVPLDGDFLHYAPLENSYAIYRTDTSHPFPAKVTDKYVEFQNRDVIGFLDALADLGCTFSQGGSWGNGAKAWMTMVPPNGSLYNAGGQFEGRIFAHWTHDGSGSVKFIPVVTDLQCTNQIAGILHMKQNIFVARHTSGLEGKVQQAREAMGLTLAYYEEFTADQARLDAIDVELSDILNGLYPLAGLEQGRARTQRENARNSIRAAHGTRPERSNSGWGVVSAVNEYEEWGQTVRNGTRSQRQLEAVASQRFPLTQRARQLVLA